MNNIYAPWRSAYFTEKEKIEGCVFCHISQHPLDDEKQGVFYRDDVCFGVMNKYPYTPGHLMLIPHQHVDTPALLKEEQWLHIHTLSPKIITMLLEGFKAQGVNMGINIKESAGAGIPAHLHIHFVPRWAGDTNFITSVANTRVYGVDFHQIFENIKTLSKKYLE